MTVPNLESLDRMLRESEQRMRQLSEIESVLAEVTGQHVTDDGLVGVELGADGELRRLEINPRAMRLDSFTLAERISEAFAGAQQNVREAAAQTMSSVLGTEDLGDVLGEARQVREGMDGLLETVSQSVNDAIVQAHRFTSRR